MTHALARRIAIATMASLAATGCQLTFDLEDYPYSPILIIADAEQDADAGPVVEDTGPDVADTGPDVPVDMPPDLPEPTGPKLVFTEFLIDSSFTAEGAGNDETGEFFEVYNAGDEAAMMALVRIDFLDPSDQDYSDNWILQVDPNVTLDPGGYFLIHRGDTPTNDFTTNIAAVRRSDVNGGGLSNDGKFRRANLVYGVQIEDTLYWNNGDMLQCNIDTDILSCPDEEKANIPGSEGSAFYLRDDAEMLRQDGNFATWCKAADVYITDLRGSPGVSNPSGICR